MTGLAWYIVSSNKEHAGIMLSWLYLKSTT